MVIGGYRWLLVIIEGYRLPPTSRFLTLNGRQRYLSCMHHSFSFTTGMPSGLCTFRFLQVWYQYQRFSKYSKRVH